MVGFAIRVDECEWGASWGTIGSVAMILAKCGGLRYIETQNSLKPHTESLICPSPQQK